MNPKLAPECLPMKANPGRIVTLNQTFEDIFQVNLCDDQSYLRMFMKLMTLCEIVPRNIHFES